MAELARGTLGDRPWGRTLAALGARQVTGEVSVITDGKLYKIGFHEGAVVSAASPLAADSAARMALTLGLVSSTQVGELSRRTQANPLRDEIDITAEFVRLGEDQAMRLRRRVNAARAARTFAIEHGDFVIDDFLDTLVMPGSEIDVRGIIYMGAAQHLTVPRLATELAKLGSWFQLKQEAVRELPQFGFAEAEQPILQPLLAGTSLAMLERYADPRVVQSIVYALAAAGLCNTTEPARPTATPVVARSQPRVATPPPPATAVPDTFTPTTRGPALDAPTMQRKTDLPTVRRPPATGNAAAQTQALIASRLKLLDAHVDHFVLLGVDEKATEERIRKAYFQLARQLHPDRLASLGMTDDNKDGQRLFAQVNAAFGVLSDPIRRAEYLDILRRGGEAAIRAEQAKADMLISKTLQAEEAYMRGESFLRRDALPQAIAELRKAVELDPDAADYQTLLTWAEFCAAGDKMSVAPKACAKLIASIKKSPQAVSPRFYLGRIERMLGRDKEALRVFESVVNLQPDHAEAIAEIRVLKTRLR